MYALGRGVPQNDLEAVHWYRQAAEQGEADAQLYLGVMYAQGRGVPDDFVLAYKWTSLAAVRGHEHAQSLLDFIRGEMTRVQIEEAQRLAGDFRPRSR